MALYRLDHPSYTNYAIDITVDGKTIVVGPFDEPLSTMAYDRLKETVSLAVKQYLRNSIEDLDNELREHGIDPSA